MIPGPGVLGGPAAGLSSAAAAAGPAWSCPSCSVTRAPGSYMECSCRHLRRGQHAGGCL